MSAIKSNNLVVPVAPLNITKDNGYSVEPNCWAHYDFSSRSFANLSGSGAALSPKSPNFLFKNGELRQVAKNDFTIQSDVNDTYDLTYALVFKVYSTNILSNHAILFGNNIYGIPNVGHGTSIGIKNTNGTNQLYLFCQGYSPQVVLCDLEVNKAYFVLVQREFATKKFAFKAIRLSDDAVMHNTLPTAYNNTPLVDGYYYNIGQGQWVTASAILDFGMSELMIWKSLQYSNVDLIYQRAKARAKIKGYI